MKNFVQRLLQQKGLKDPKYNITEIIMEYILSKIYWVQCFIVEGGCMGCCGNGIVLLSFSPIQDKKDIIQLKLNEIQDEDEEDDIHLIVEQYGCIHPTQTIYTQSDRNYNYAYCSGWYRDIVYMDKKKCYEPDTTEDESEYGIIKSYTYETLYKQLVGHKIIKLTITH